MGILSRLKNAFLSTLGLKVKKRKSRKTKTSSLRKLSKKTKPAAQARSKVKKNKTRVLTKAPEKISPEKTKPLKSKRPKPVLKGELHLNAAKPLKIKAKAGSPQKVKEGLQPVGRVTHYFPKAGAAALLIESGEISIGDVLCIQTPTGPVKQRVKSLQINRIPIDTGRTGEEVGLQVAKEVASGNPVYKVKKP